MAFLEHYLISLGPADLDKDVLERVIPDAEIQVLRLVTGFLVSAEGYELGIYPVPAGELRRTLELQEQIHQLVPVDAKAWNRLRDATRGFRLVYRQGRPSDAQVEQVRRSLAEHQDGALMSSEQVVDWRGVVIARSAPPRTYAIRSRANGARSLDAEVERLREILEDVELPFAPSAPAAPQVIAKAERELGVGPDSDLRRLYQLSDGSNGAIWFGVVTDQDACCTFLSLGEVGEYRELFSRAYDSPRLRADRRIQPVQFHVAWFPFAALGDSVVLYLDHAPTSCGSVGQVIAYQHDPDAMYYVAPSFLAFFERSNAVLEANASEFLG